MSSLFVIILFLCISYPDVENFDSSVEQILASNEIENKVQQLVIQKLDEFYPSPLYKVQVEVKRIPFKLKEVDAKEIEEVQFLTPSKPKGYERIRLQTQSNNMESGYSSLAQVHIRVWQHLPLLSNTKSGGENVQESDFRMDWFEITQLSGSFIQNIQEIEPHKVLSRMLKAGQPIRDIDLIAPAVVEAGDPITVIMQKSGFQIQFMCTARQDGAVGDQIRCYSADNRKTYSAIILDRNKALWNATY